MQPETQYRQYGFIAILAARFAVAAAPCFAASAIGQEHALPRHLADGEEFTLSPQALIAWGSRIFQANWTIRDGAGRWRTKAHETSSSTRSFAGRHGRSGRPQSLLTRREKLFTFARRSRTDDKHKSVPQTVSLAVADKAQHLSAFSCRELAEQ